MRFRKIAIEISRNSNLWVRYNMWIISYMETPNNRTLVWFRFRKKKKLIIPKSEWTCPRPCNCLASKSGYYRLFLSTIYYNMYMYINVCVLALFLFRFPRLLYRYRYNIFIRPQLFGDQSSDKRNTPVHAHYTCI